MEQDYKFVEMKTKLTVPCILDVLDGLGHREQAMDYTIRPIDIGDVKIMGPARTFLLSESGKPPQDYEKRFDGFEKLTPGDVVVVSTQGVMSASCFGENFALRTKYLRAEGAVLDGAIRNIDRISALKLPVYHKGIAPCNSHGRLDMSDFDCEISCGGVKVKPGDIIFADKDGIAVIPQKIAEKALRIAFYQMEKITISRNKLTMGGSLPEVFDRYGAF